jgi:hypothetical protein
VTVVEVLVVWSTAPVVASGALASPIDWLVNATESNASASFELELDDVEAFEDDELSGEIEFELLEELPL